MTILEPVLAPAFLQQKGDFTPAVLGRVTRYPAKFTGAYDKATDAYMFAFSDFAPVQ